MTGHATGRRMRRGLALTALALVFGALAAGSVAVLVVAMIVSVLGGGLANAPFYVVFILVPASLGSVGAVLAIRRPSNAVGWLLLVSGALAGLAFAGGQYVAMAEAAGHLDWPFVVAAAWISDVWFVPAIGLLVVYLPLLFPTGRLLGPRWRIVAWIGVFGVATGALGPAFAPGALDDNGTLANPLAASEPLLGWIQVATRVSNAIAPVIFVVAVASLLIRFRRSQGVEREQIKWFLFVAALSAAAFGVSLINLPAISDLAWFVGLVSLALLPLAIGVAILRYRLYEIDRIVSRAVAYTVVTAVLAATFAAVVLVAQATLEPVTHSNAFGIAASTLLVAALFQPVRRRVQAVVDGRFNRRRYDAERELEAFVAKARDEVEIDRLAGALAATLVRTVEPTSAAVWLRQASSR